MSDRVTVRQARLEDLDDILRVEASAWPEGIRASGEQFIERLETYPEGFLIADLYGRPSGVLTSQRIDHRLGDEPAGWEETTAGGRIRATHLQSGNSLYVVSVGVAAESQGMGVGSRLIRAAQQHAVAHRLQYVLLDSRLPGYGACRRDRGLTAEEYVFALDDRGWPLDPELRFYRRHGFQILSPSQIIRSCMARDHESAKHGVRMVWPTTLYYDDPRPTARRPPPPE
jgi:ribosomal protein S18 acetylase RimI-like enzyme